jgi:hypothetical protein
MVTQHFGRAIGLLTVSLFAQVSGKPMLPEIHYSSGYRVNPAYGDFVGSKRPSVRKVESPAVAR